MSPREKNISSIGKRIIQIIDSKGINRGKLADDVGISAGYLSEIISGKKVPSKTVATAIQGLYGYSADWLLTGEGSPQGGVAEDSSPYAGGFSAGSERYFEKTRTSDIDSPDRDGIDLQASVEKSQEEAVKDDLIESLKARLRDKDKLIARLEKDLEKYEGRDQKREAHEGN